VSDCEWTGCSAVATHRVAITFPGEAVETWAVCRGHDRELKLQAVSSRPAKPAEIDEPSPNVVYCGACGALLDERSDAPERTPCPNCKSTSRRIDVRIAERVTVYDAIRARTKTPGKGGWMLDTSSGDNYTRKLQAWGKREVTKDRAHDLYREVIELWDGTRIESTARLSDHHE
jgi:hypothetical protein